jgi:hypothetical protein
MRSLALMFNGNTLNEADELGELIVDDSFLILMNSCADSVSFRLPLSPLNRGWNLVMNTDDLDQPFCDRSLDGTLDVAGRSVVLLRELARQASKPANSETIEVPETAQAADESVPPATDDLPAEPVPVMADPLPVD